MTSSPDSTSPRLRPMPRGQVQNWWLWPQPIAPGFYGNAWTGTLWITSNHLPTVIAAGKTGKLVLALEAGGLHPFIASAFDPGMVDDLRNHMQAIESGRINTAQVDPALARRLSIEINVANEANPYLVNSIPKTDLFQVPHRLAGALLLTAGQAVIFLASLLLFGRQHLLTGLGVLFLAGILLSLLWPLPRQKCSKCRLVLSIISTCIAVMSAWFVLGLESDRIAWLAASWWVASFWLSFIFIGVRH